MSLLCETCHIPMTNVPLCTGCGAAVITGPEAVQALDQHAALWAARALAAQEALAQLCGKAEARRRVAHALNPIKEKMRADTSTIPSVWCVFCDGIYPTSEAETHWSTCEAHPAYRAMNEANKTLRVAENQRDELWHGALKRAAAGCTGGAGYANFRGPCGSETCAACAPLRALCRAAEKQEAAQRDVRTARGARREPDAERAMRILGLGAPPLRSVAEVAAAIRAAEQEARADERAQMQERVQAAIEEAWSAAESAFNETARSYLAAQKEDGRG